MQPTQLGPYKIRGPLGRGGMGAVYEAEDPASGRRVAVKTMAAHVHADAGLRRRFLAEIDALKALRHPGIVELLAFGEQDGLPYFAMELVAGKSLEQVLRAGRVFSWQETVAVAAEVVRALKVAHDHGVVHRDLKPANLLLLDEPADGVTVKLADFGIARLFGDGGETMAGTVVGTAEYMAPEQAAGRPVDQRADLYALGLVMYAMLTGRPPFHGGDVARILDRQRREAPPRVAAVAPQVPPELDAVVDRLLAKDPAQRPANALAVGRLLAAIATNVAERGSAGTAANNAGSQPTLPVRAAAGGRPLIDHTAATRAMPAAATSDLVIDAAAATERDQATDAAAGATAAGRDRFTTVDALDRAAREQAGRERDRRRAWRLAAAAAIGGGLVALGFAVLRRPTADELHGRILAIATDDDADLRDARPLIDEFLARHARDPRVEAVRDLDRRLDLDALERRTRRRPPADRPVPPIERDYRAAMAREADSPTACVAALEAILTMHAAGGSGPAADDSPALWLALVRRQIDRLGPRAAAEREEDAARARVALDRAATLAAAAAATADEARREALSAERRTLLQSLVELNAARPHMHEIVAEARRLLGADAVEQPPDARP